MIVRNWDSTLEGNTTAAPARLGVSLIGGMRVEAAEQPFVDVTDFARRATLDRHDLTVLVHAGARRSMAKGRGGTGQGHSARHRARRRGTGAAAGL
nr:hypothetical protein [Burkholderia gladioli]